MRSLADATFTVAAAALTVVLGCSGATQHAAVRPEPPAASPAATPASPAAPVVDPAQELALARAARAAGRSADELAHLDQVVRADEASFDARIELVQHLLERNADLGRAGRLLAEADTLRPGDVRVDRLHGWLDELQGDDEHAAFRYQRVLAVTTDPELRLRRAMLLQRLGRDDDALQEFRRIVAERPGDRAARAGMAELLEARGRLAEAEALLAEIVRVAPTQPGPLHDLAAFYRRQGETAKASEAERRARSLEGAPRALRPLRPSSR